MSHLWIPMKQENRLPLLVRASFLSMLLALLCFCSITLNSQAKKHVKIIKVSDMTLEIIVDPEPPGDPGPYLDADGTTQLSVRARLLESGNPVAGKRIKFTASLVVPSTPVLFAPEVSPKRVITNASGYATTTLTAPRYEESTPPEVEVIVEATYRKLTSATAPIKFTYYTIPSLKLQSIKAKLGGSTWNPVSSYEFIPGDPNTIRFRPKLAVMGSSDITVWQNIGGKLTSFYFTDQENNGSSVYLSNLLANDNGKASSNGSITIRFSSLQLPPGFIYGHYSALITLQYKNSFGQAFEEILNVTDDLNKIRVGAKEQGIQIINWREKLETTN